MWFSLGLTGLAGVLSALAVIATNTSSHSVTHLIERLFMLMRGAPQSLPTLPQLVALSLAVNLVVLGLGSLVVTSLRLRSRHRSHGRAIDLVSQADDRWPEVSVIDFAHPVAYFLPGNGGRIVVAQQLVANLTEEQVSVIVTHERGHRQQSTRTLLALRSLLPFFSVVPYARLSDRVLHRVVEFEADAYAAAVHGAPLVQQLLREHADFEADRHASPSSAAELTRRIERLGSESSHPYRFREVFWLAAAVGLSLLLLV
jgi:Zn-dependent protease with chaperone function